MKNLANCKPSEFVRQTSRIKKAVEKWLTETDIMNIRKHVPKLTDDMTAEEKHAALDKQVSENTSKIFDACFEAHPDETLALLALVCFVEPENVDDYPMSDYLASIVEMANSEAAMGFFTLLTRLGQNNTQSV